MIKLCYVVSLFSDSSFCFLVYGDKDSANRTQKLSLLAFFVEGAKILLPIKKKNVAHGLEKLRATSQKNTGNVFQNYGQCFLKLWAILFTATGNENSMLQCF